ncbi:hypothetical protein [Salibacter halophilus]|uniref:Outer membrane protein assembly factor BamE n=1 Tax=Salibacter halophilus TaxID=1803916 RepID=A0A6N6M4D7_9FLAO|nr:hypothetical protein [Salibacter halophilus]KAB1062051.1 hypothetical protein F3059_13320 [Salibacter halophilus]
MLKMLQLSKPRPAALLVLLAFISASCTLLMPKEKRQCYRTLKDFADKYWKFKDSLLIENEELFKVGRGGEGKINNCLKKMSKKDIKRLFGKPHEVSLKKSGTGHYLYFMMEDCKPISKAKYCIYYAFEFNSENQCTDISTGTVATEN